MTQPKYVPRHYVEGQPYSPPRRPLPYVVNEPVQGPVVGPTKEQVYDIYDMHDALDSEIERLAYVFMGDMNPMVVQHFGLPNLDTKAG